MSEPVPDPVETLRDEAIVKVDEPVDEVTCGFCGIVSVRCPGPCCQGCDCPS